MTAPLIDGALDLEARRALVGGTSALNGVDFVEVLANHPGRPGHVPLAPRQRTLLVHLLHAPVPPGLDASRVRVLGGVRVDPRINPVRVRWAYPATDVTAGPLPDGVTGPDRALVAGAVPVGRRDRVLVVRTSSSGDWSTYVLALLGAAGATFPAGFDEPLSAQPFTFTVDCPDDLDCAADDACPPLPPASPLLDYLARDYDALRTRLLDRLATLGWTDPSPADPLVTLVELFAAVGDRLTYRQDAIAAEANLSTARHRASVRRHARLLDYRMHEGCAARVWLTFRTTAPVTLPARTPVACAETPLPPGADVEVALDTGATVFETLDPVRLLPARGALALHAWGDAEACLPAGATSAFVRHPPGADPGLAAGDVVVLAPLDEDGVRVTGDEGRRRAVRLDRDPLVRADPLAPGGATVLELHWSGADALLVPLPVARRAADGSAAPAAVALANVALAEHAASLPRRRLLPPQVPAERPFAPRLPAGRTGAAWVDPVVDRTSATAALRPEPGRALPAVQLDDGARTWLPVPDLLGSGPLDAHFVAEPASPTLVRLRFGDGVAGRRPAPGGTPEVWQRAGGGPAGNVGPDVLTTLLPGLVAAVPAGVVVTNPLPAAGGTAPESADAVKELAPYAFRTQLRTVTSADYTTAASGQPGVQRAVARRRWTGSWHAQEVTLDPTAERAGDATVGAGVAALLDVRRLAGTDVELAEPVYVPLEIVLGVCVADGYLAADVERQLRARLSTGVLADGRLGFFHPDLFTFGQSLFVSDLVAAVMAVPGVALVEVGDDDSGLRWRRLGRPAAGEVALGRIDAAAREVLRADSDPSNPEHGRVGFRLGGGA